MSLGIKEKLTFLINLNHSESFVGGCKANKGVKSRFTTIMLKQIKHKQTVEALCFCVYTFPQKTCMLHIPGCWFMPQDSELRCRVNYSDIFLELSFFGRTLPTAALYLDM